jgi:hypothetical protein
MKGPAGLDSTAVKVTLGRVRDFTLSHGVCADNAPGITHGIAKAASREILLKVILEGLAGPEYKISGQVVEAITFVLLRFERRFTGDWPSACNVIPDCR